MRDVTILLIDGGHSSTAIGPMEVFHSAGVLWNRFAGEPEAPLFRVSTASIDGKPVRADGALRLTPDCAISDVGDADLIFMPSVGLELDRAIARNARTLAWLRERRAAGAAIAGVCSGVALLAEAELLERKRATTHWAFAEDYGRRYPGVRWQPKYFVTEDDDIFCGGGVHAAFDLSLYPVENFHGPAAALQTAKALLVDMPRTWQAGFALLPMHTRHRDERILGAEEWIHEHWTEEFRFEDLAARVGMSPRNFVRRFKFATGEAPLAYLQKLRIAAAKRMLEDEHRTVREIGLAVGYEDAAYFRNLFKRHTGTAPTGYRQRFGRVASAA